MGDFTPPLKETLRAYGCYFVRQGKATMKSGLARFHKRTLLSMARLNPGTRQTRHYGKRDCQNNFESQTSKGICAAKLVRKTHPTAWVCVDLLQLLQYFFKPFGYPDFNNGLTGNADPVRLFIKRINHPRRKIDIHFFCI